MGSRPKTLVMTFRGADAGATYFYWRWMDERHDPHPHVITRAELDPLLVELESALLHRRPGETHEECVQRSLRDGAFFDSPRELDLATRLGQVILPADLRAELRRVGGDPQHLPRIRIHPSPRTFRVPWELLDVGDGKRLLEVAVVELEVPASASGMRSRPPDVTWEGLRGRPVVYVIDPTLNGVPVLGSTVRLESGNSLYNVLAERIDERRAMIQSPDVVGLEPRGLVGKLIHREGLGRALRTGPSRLVYVGHASAVNDQEGRPDAAAIHLSDTSNDFGMATAIGTGDGHRPMTALDFFAGTLLCSFGPTDLPQSPLMPDRDLPTKATPGCEIWPMPTRVLLLGCESGTDHRFAETFGLVIAFVDAGAEIVTATRWTLPTDSGMGEAHGLVGADKFPITDMAAAVDRAHDQQDPFSALRRWQLEKLNAWRSGQRPSDSPLLWGALASFHAPRQRTDRD